MIDRLRDERVQLQEQHHFLSRILAVSPLGALFLDFDGRVAYVNPAAERLLEQPGAHLQGKPLGGPRGAPGRGGRGPAGGSVAWSSRCGAGAACAATTARSSIAGSPAATC